MEPTKADLLPEEINAEDAKKSPMGSMLYPDPQALQLVLDDLDKCDAFMTISMWASNWALSDVLIQSPQNTNMGSNGTCTNIPDFTLSNAISAIQPKLMESLFYEDPPFLLRPRPGTSQDIVRAKTALFAAQLTEMKFETQCERLFAQMALLGTCIAKYGWTEKTETKKVYSAKAEPEKITSPTGFVSTIHTPDSDEIVWEYEETKKYCPWLKFVDRRTIRVDPGCRVGDIQEAKYVIETQYPNYHELDDLREMPDYDVPSESVLREFFEREEGAMVPGDNLTMTLPEGMRGWLQHAVPRNHKTTSDPLETPLLLIERQDKYSIITVLVHGADYILIRNSENPACKITYFSANWRDLPDCFDGQGLGQLIGAEQIRIQGTKNLATDILAYGLHPQAVRKKGFNTPTQSIIWKQGGIIDVDDDVDKAFKFLQFPAIPAEAWQYVSEAKATAEETSGANQQTTMGAGAQGVKTTGMRSGTGAAAVVQANASRLDNPIGRFIRQIFVPFLYELDQMNNQFLPSSALRMILDETSAKGLEIDQKEFRNAQLEYEVLAGAHLGPKKEMAQFMPFILQIANNPVLMQAAADQGLNFQFDAFFKIFCDLAGFKYSQQFFSPQTAAQKQKSDANSPAAMAAAKQQGAQSAQTAQFSHEQQMEDQKQIGKAANQVLRQTLEHATETEANTGEPGNVGFGSQTTG
jgi:hypothetical protein